MIRLKKVCAYLVLVLCKIAECTFNSHCYIKGARDNCGRLFVSGAQVHGTGLYTDLDNKGHLDEASSPGTSGPPMSWKVSYILYDAIPMANLAYPEGDMRKAMARFKGEVSTINESE